MDNCKNKDFISAHMILKAASILHRKTTEGTQYIMVPTLIVCTSNH